MTVGQLRERLARHDDELPVYVRCQWEGEAPAVNVFAPYVLVQEVEPDIGNDFVVIECDQTADD